MTSGPSESEKENASHDLADAIERRNFARAERLARTLNRPRAEIRDFQEKAFRQFVVELRNPQGAIALAREFNFTEEDVDHLLTSILQEAKLAEQEGAVEYRRRFDMKTKRYLDLKEWIREYFKSRKWKQGQKTA